MNGSCSLRYRNSSNEIGTSRDAIISDRILAVSLASKLPLEVNSHQNGPPSFPLNPRNVLVHYSKYLLDHERTEILEYD